MSLVAECSLLRWPQSITQRVLARLPRRHQSDFCELVRYCGRELRFFRIPESGVYIEIEILVRYLAEKLQSKHMSADSFLAQTVLQYTS